jgi:tetratricopeptide (TPR) repeat protein
MGDEVTTNTNEGNSSEEDDLLAGIVGTAVLSGIAWWGLNKVAKLFKTPETNDQPDLLNLAWKHYANSDIDKGREHLYKWASINHEKVLELNNVSWHLSTEKIDAEAAVVIAEHIVQKAPRDAMYWDTLAEAYLAADRQEDAQSACNMAWKYTPDRETQFMLHLRMGRIYEMQPLIKLAIQQYHKAEAIKLPCPPYDIADVYFGLGRCHAANEDWGRSIQALEQSLEHCPGNPVIKTFLANGLIGIDPPRLQEAQNHLQYALNAAPEWELPYYLMACAKAKAGDCNGAAQWCEKGIRHFKAELVEALKAEPLLERCRRQLLEVLVGNGLMSKQEYDEVISPRLNLPNLSLGAANMQLRHQLETSKPNALPYFISFYTAEGQPLAEELRSRLGDTGFLSANDLQTGSQWKRELVKNLKLSKTFLMLETPLYHTRPSCRIERAFAVAAGMRVVRVGLCPSKKLPDYPSYVDEFQYKDFAENEDPAVILENILNINLPSPIEDVKTRRDAGKELVKALTPGQLEELADGLRFGEEIQDKVGSMKINAFLRLAFRTELSADKFCKELDLSSLFK